jgi:methylated-DNA-[protein]-cysteine S-methyltransferase
MLERVVRREQGRNIVTFYSWFDWPLGHLLLTSDGEALTGVYFSDGRDAPRLDAWKQADNVEPFQRVRDQLRAYWQGGLYDFDLPLRQAGTAFQRRVWKNIADVPFGQTITYRQLAGRSGSSQASRAAGLATGRNPISIIVPCHRVVGSNGSLTGYGGGLDRKRALLEFEAAVASGARVVLERERTLFATKES